MGRLSRYRGSVPVGQLEQFAFVAALQNDAVRSVGANTFLKTGTYIEYDAAEYPNIVAEAPGLLRLLSITSPREAYSPCFTPAGSGRFYYRSKNDAAVNAVYSSATKGGTLVPNATVAAISGKLVRIKTGASAGRVLCPSQLTVQYFDGGSPDSTSVATGTSNKEFVAVNSDGSLCAVWRGAMGTAAADVFTSNNAGTTWTSRTPSAAVGTVGALVWAPSLNLFLASTSANTSALTTSVDGFTMVSLPEATIGVDLKSTANAGSAFAVTPTATLVNGNNGVTARHKAGAWAPLTTPAAFVGIYDDDNGNVYGTDGRRFWKSSDDGDTWTGPSYRPRVSDVTAATVVVFTQGAVSIGTTVDAILDADDPVGAPPEAIGTPTVTGANTEQAFFVCIK